MAEVETTSQQYVPLATSCSSIYFSMEALQQVQHFFYNSFPEASSLRSLANIDFTLYHVKVHIICERDFKVIVTYLLFRHQLYMNESFYFDRYTSCTNTRCNCSWRFSTPCCRARDWVALRSTQLVCPSSPMNCSRSVEEIRK